MAHIVILRAGSRGMPQQHPARMQSMTRAAGCNAYVTQHREQMAERAKERRITILARPRCDACAGVKP